MKQGKENLNIVWDSNRVVEKMLLDHRIETQVSGHFTKHADTLF